MSPVVFQSMVSLDGYHEGPGADLSWHAVDEEVHQHMNEVLAPAGAFLSGRVTYELMAGYWPTADADPAEPASVREFAGIWRDMPKVVYSRTLEEVGPNSTLVRAVVPAEVRALQEQTGGELVLGGPTLARTFRGYDLIDEYRLYVAPVLLGRGTQVFGPAGSPTGLRLVDTRTFGNGLVRLHYRRA